MKMVYDEYDESKNHYYRLRYNTDKRYIISKLLSRDGLLCVCGGIYKSELFRKTKIHFDTSLIMAEDWLVLLNLLANSKHIIDLPEVFYFYNQLNEGSCSNNPTIGKIENCLQAMEQISKIKGIEDNGYDKSIAAGWCVIWKALVRGLILNEQTFNDFILKLNKMKKLYYFPQLKNILTARISVMPKIFLIMSLMKPTQIIVYRFVKNAVSKSVY